MGIEKLVRPLIVTLAAARLTRFITTDWLGEWTLVGPFKRHAERWEQATRAEYQQVLDDRFARWAHHDHGERQRTLRLGERLQRDDEPLTWVGKMAHGLDCPFCVGFWIGGAVLVGEHLTRRAPSPVRALWEFELAALAMNYVVGHVSSRID